MNFVFDVESITQNGEGVDYARGAEGEEAMRLYFKQYEIARAFRIKTIEIPSQEAREYLVACEKAYRQHIANRAKAWADIQP